MLQDNHKLIAGPLPFVKLPPGKYCVISNPTDKRCVLPQITSFRSTLAIAAYLLVISDGVLFCFISKPLGKEGKRFELNFGHREVRLHGVSEESINCRRG